MASPPSGLKPAPYHCVGEKYSVPWGDQAAFQAALDWYVETKSLCKAGDCALSLNSLILDGSAHLVVAEAFVSALDSTRRSLGRGAELPPEAQRHIAAHRSWIKDLRAAAAEATALGLDGEISYKYWQQNIELPEAVTTAQRWFNAAVKLINAMDEVKFARVLKLCEDAAAHIKAMDACRSSWPRARTLSIERRYCRYSLLVAKWGHATVSATLAEMLKNRDADTVRIEFFSQKEKETRDNLRNGTAAVLRTKNRRRAIRANMLRKRTCSMCGKTAPNSSPSFAYCGGCHGFQLRECIPRFCSEACQRAHWAAGHKHECPCVHLCARDE